MKGDTLECLMKKRGSTHPHLVCRNLRGSPTQTGTAQANVHDFGVRPVKKSMDAFFHSAKLIAYMVEVRLYNCCIRPAPVIGEMTVVSFFPCKRLMGVIPKKWRDVYSPASHIFT